MINIPPAQLEEIKAALGNASAASEGGRDYVLIKSLKLPAGCDPQVSDVLFCPNTSDSYQSRLFFPAPISHKGRGTNWHFRNVYILGKSWSALSWKINSANDRILTKLLAHLEAFRP